jgi:hypothetical protein
VAHKTGALATGDLERIVVDTTVQPKAIAHPTDARLCHRALVKLVDLARRHHVPLRQSYRRVAKRAAIMVGRYTHTHQFKRAGRALKFLRIRLGRVIRDIRRQIAGNEPLEERFADLLALAVRVRFQDHRQCGPKVYALHAPEVECIGKGKARAPYEWRGSLTEPGQPGEVIVEIDEADFDRGRAPCRPCARGGRAGTSGRRRRARSAHAPGRGGHCRGRCAPDIRPVSPVNRFHIKLTIFWLHLRISIISITLRGSGGEKSHLKVVLAHQTVPH